MSLPVYSFYIEAPLEWRPRKGTGKMVAAPKWINANHHNLSPFKRNDLTQEWREIAMVRARAAKLPQGLVDRVFIEAFIHPADNRSYDAQNLYPTAKAIVDGLVTGKGKITGYGMLPDDSNRHVVGPICLPGEPLQRPGVTIRVHALPAGALYPPTYTPFARRGKDLR